MLAEEIQNLTEINILNDSTFIRLFEIDSEVERIKAEDELLKKAKSLGVVTPFKKRLMAHKKEFKKFQRETKQFVPLNVDFRLEYTDKGAVKNSIKNYYSILRNDEQLKGKIIFNELSGEPEKVLGDKIVEWTDVDDSNTRCYIEEKYGIYSEKKLNDALNLIFQDHSYNPVKDIIESIEWDGKSRIHTLLSKWLGVADDCYSREVSRLIFAGGIHRLYNPGCKFDDMPVLIGTKQGEGKSSFVSWLALQDNFFREVKEIEGQKGMEVLKGAWICEMGELLALTKAKEVEAVKAYITCRVDVYRSAYGKRINKQKRSCIFIGTTNKTEFLTDKTGNRRFYPVVVDCTGYYLHDHKDEIMEDIEQCWAEALALYKQGKLMPYADVKLVDEIRERQESAVEDDFRVGMIEKYLENKNEVCVLEVWRNALLNDYTTPSKKDSCDIGLILSKVKGWQKGKGTRRFMAYGSQKYWERIPNDDNETLPF
ncbi:MAG: hypothetical protein E7231_00310 [Cellulosilyticum sp.]|nr:hypothetical protein [Cellulosilyticum sp.]